MPSTLIAPATRDHAPFHPLPAAAGYCMVIPNFLTRQECAEMIAASETRGFAGADSDYPPSYRNNERQVRDDPALAAQLLPRLHQYAPATWPGAEVSGPAQDWHLHTINERFRFCRYRPGQQFNLHQDGVHHRSAEVRSCLTFMIYLTDSDAFTGGDTLFYAAGPGQAAREIGRVQPRAGSLILFDHRLWHSGEQVTAGVKHIMRSDVLYSLASAPAPAAAQPFTPGHQGYIWTLAALGQGLLASGGRDSIIRIWDEQGRAIRQLHGHSQSVLGLAALPGQRLASVSRDRSLRIWDSASGRCERTVIAHDKAILGVASLPDATLATYGADGLIKLWDVDGRALASLAGHGGWVWDVAVLDDAHFASASEDGSVKIWQCRERRCLATLPGEVALRTLVVADQGRRIVTGNMAGELVIWQRGASGWQIARRIQAHCAAVRRLRLFAPDCLASCGEDNRVRIWRDGELVAETCHDNFATDALQVAGGILSSAYDGRLLLSPATYPG